MCVRVVTEADWLSPADGECIHWRQWNWWGVGGWVEWSRDEVESQR